MSRILSFVKWFVVFGLSFLVADWGWTEQGKAFLYIDLGIVGFFVLIIIVILLVLGDGAGQKIGLSLASIVIFMVEIAIALFATWGATKLFDVDFYVAYQIMSFGQCLCDSISKKED